MKRTSMLFSACLTLLMGTGSAMAQSDATLPTYYESGDDVTEITSGQRICLTPAGQNDYNPGKYLNWSGTNSSTTDVNDVVSLDNVTDKGVFYFEATGNTVDGHPTYYLRLDANGQYVRQETRGSQEGDDAYIHFTDNRDEAFEVTVLHPDESATAEGNWRQYSASGGTEITITPEAYIIAAAEKQHDEPLYLLAYNVWGIWTDTNEWYVRTVSEQSPGNTLLNAIQNLMPNGLDNYRQGEGVGALSAAAYSALQSAYNEATGLGGNDDRDACNAAYAAFLAAKDAADAALVVPTGKYYYFVGYRNASGLTTNGEILTSSSNYTVPEKPTVNEAAYLWIAEDAGDGYVYLKNYGTGLYAGTVGSNSTSIPMTEQPQARYKIPYSSNNSVGGTSLAGYYNITPERSDAVSLNVGNSGEVVFWGDITTDPGDFWTVVAVSDEDVAAIEEAVRQQQLNKNLETLYKTALEAYNDGRVYAAEEGDVYNGNFDFIGLIADASQLSSNAKEESEGSYEGLLDSDLTTYFHTSWSGAAINEYHYLQIDLNEDVQTMVLKMAKRTNNQDVAHPQKFDIYATNNPDGEWTYEGSYKVNWAYSVMVNDEEKTNVVGTAGVQMSQPYRYIRFTVTETTMNQLNGSYPFWYLSKLDAYKATYDADASYYNQVSADVRTAFETQLAAARAEYVAQTATQATIDALQSAYDALQAQLPNPARLQEAIAAAKAACPPDSVIGVEIGQFPQDAVDNLNQAIASVESTLADIMSLEAINSGIATLDAAVTALNNAVVLPEVGGYYVIRGMTSDANNTRALRAMVYSTGNSTTTALRSLQTNEDGTDAIVPVDDIRYVWKVESVGNGKIVLRNVGTGFYIGTQSELGAVVANVPEATELGIEPIRTAAGFYLQVGEDLYMNFQGQGVNMVAWNSHSGTDNSSLTFEAVDASQFTGSMPWNVSAGVYQVLTLPISVEADFGEDATIYDVLGQKQDGDNYTIELQEYSASTIPAGTPVVIRTNAGVNSIMLLTEAYSVEDITYASAGSSNANGALTGVIANTVLPSTEAGKASLRNGSAVIIGGAATENERTIAANTGYFNFVETTETGDASITLPASIVSGIGNTTLVDANAKVDVYTLSGVQVRKGVKAADATTGLPAGLYIVGGQKVLVK